MHYQIKEMTEEYYEDKAYVHHTAWPETYRGLMPDEYINNHNFEHCYKFTVENPQNTLIALADQKVAGFVWYSPVTREYAGRPGTSEINALYVLKKYQGFGIGKALMEHALRTLPHAQTVLFVLQGNEHAIEFYKHMGFRFTGKSITAETRYGVITELEMMK